MPEAPLLSNSLHELGLVADGDPLSRRTWSGTPLALATAANLAGVEIRASSGTAPRFALDALAATNGLVQSGMPGKRFRHYVSPLRGAQHKIWSTLRHEWGPNMPVLHTDQQWLLDGPIGARDFLFRDVHLVDHLSRRNASQGFIRRATDRLLEGVKGAGHLFATSKWCADRFEEFGVHSSRISVVGTGAAISFEDIWSQGEQERSVDTNHLLCVAKVRHKDKGVDLLTRAFVEVRRYRPDAKLTLVAPRGSVESAPGVEVLSDLSFDALRKLYVQCALYVMPARYEPWGLVYLEAMLAGTPIIASTRCAGPEMTDGGRCGWNVEDLSPRQVAATILEALDDRDELLRRGHRARLHAAKFTWKTTSQKILNQIAHSMTG